MVAKPKVEHAPYKEIYGILYPEVSHRHTSHSI